MRYLFLSVWLLASTAYGVEPSDLLRAVDAVRAPGKDFAFSLRVVRHRKGETVSEFRFRVWVKDSVKSLVTYEAPPSARGKHLLMVGQNMWFYTPGIRRPIRISPEQQLLGQVSNADVVRVVYGIDYRPVSMTPQSVNGTQADLLQLEAHNPGSTYQKIALLVGRGDSRPLV